MSITFNYKKGVEWIKNNPLAASIAFTYLLEVLIILAFKFNFVKASPFLVLGLILGMGPYLVYSYIKYKKIREMEEIFPEFLRNVAETVRSGVNLPQAIITASKVDYGALTPEIKKMAAQLSWGIPLPRVLELFSERVKDSPFLRRSIAIISQAYTSGGNIAEVMERVAEASNLIRKLHTERRSKFFQQVLVVYAIFIIFIAMIIALNKIIMPIYTFSQISARSGLESISPFTASITEADFRSLFLHMIVIQAIFTGLIIGAILEGKVQAGLKHSTILLILGLVTYFVFLPPNRLSVIVPKVFDFGRAGREYTVAGMVITQDKIPVPDAEVTIRIKETGETYITKTDKFGNFRQIIILPDEKGTYRIEISAKSGRSYGDAWIEVTTT